MADPVTLLAVCGVVLLAAATQAITGFGFALVALAILGLRLDLPRAVVLIAPAGLALNLLLFSKFWREFSWDGLVPLVVACLVGVPIGAWMVLTMESDGLKLLLATVMIVTSVHRFWLLMRKSRVQEWHPVKAGIPCGLLSGVLGGAFGAGGPPVVSYLINRPVNRYRYVASMQVVAGLCSGIRLVQFSWAGRYQREDLLLILPSLAAVYLGVGVGARLLRVVSDQLVRNVIIGFLFLGGSYYLFQS